MQHACEVKRETAGLVVLCPGVEGEAVSLWCLYTFNTICLSISTGILHVAGHVAHLLDRCGNKKRALDSSRGKQGFTVALACGTSHFVHTYSNCVIPA